MSSQHFSQIPKAEIQRSSFDRSHGHKTTIDGGYLYPIFLDEALPGDTFNLKMHAIARMATPIFPIMDNVYIDTHFFAVPYRLVWSNWEKFNGAQNNPNDSTDYTIPRLANGTLISLGSLGDYFGLPIAAGFGTEPVSCLPFRAYNLIFNEWFRDQNLQDWAGPIPYDGDGPDNVNLFPIQRRGKRHDYFTSCLPWPQKGPAVDIPLGGSAPIQALTNVSGTDQKLNVRDLSGTLIQPFGVTVNGDLAMNSSHPATGVELVADLTQATAATINSLRQAFAVQRQLERDARGGTRYTEVIKASFGVTSPDARLQRPEYLGGFSQPITMSQIHQTSRTDEAAGTPLGQVGGIGTAVLTGHNNSFTTSFTEHCIVIGLVSVRSEMTYQQKLDRMWSRRTRFDFYWPALSHIGEQAVLNKEIHWTDTATGNVVFGYQERYGEYRYKPSQVTNLFRSNAPQSLDSWHLAYDFTAQPVLNASFIQENPPLDRVVAVPSEPKFLLDTWFEFTCARPMPMYGVPGLIDHF